MPLVAKRRTSKLATVVEIRTIGILGGAAICLLILIGVVLTESRVAAAFREPVAYARSFFYRDTLKPYGEAHDPAAPMISIQIDPQTGEARINQAQSTEGGAPALKLDVIGSAAQDARGAPPIVVGKAPEPPARLSPVPSRPPGQ